MRSARQALTDIAALCDEWAGSTRSLVTPDWVSREVRAVLAHVEPEPAVVWDRDAARKALRKHGMRGDLPEVLDALEGSVRPAPAQIIDRDAVARHLCEMAEGDPEEGKVRPRWHKWREEADALIAAATRPVDGVILTREEAQQCAAALLTEDSIWGLDPKNKALADRLAVAQ